MLPRTWSQLPCRNMLVRRFASAKWDHAPSYHARPAVAPQCPASYTPGASMLQHTIRASRIVLGLALVGVGLVLALPLVPGPGLLVILVGLTVLSAEFEWARRLRDRLHAMFRRVTGRADVR